jgi:hypothetical protein
MAVTSIVRAVGFQKNPPEPLVSKSKPKPKSKKQAAADRIYQKLRTLFFQDPRNHICKARLPGCQYEATEVHHTKGRGIFYLVVETWLAVCRKCHDRITEHSKEAIAMGLSKSRLKKDNINEDIIQEDDWVFEIEAPLTSD